VYAQTGYKKFPSPVPVGPAIAPALLSRVPLFDPTFRRAIASTVTAETPWGRVKRVGRITETHRKILDALFATALDRHCLATGAMALLIDPYRVSKVAHVAHNPQWLRRMLLELRVVEITLETPAGARYTGGIISELYESPTRRDMPGGALRGDRPLWVVTISAAWMRMYDAEIVVKYRNILPVLNGLTSGAVHALALHILSHSGSGVYDVESVLHYVGAWREDMSLRAKRGLLREVEAEAERLGQLGMAVYRRADGPLMIAYHPRPDVQVQGPHPEE